MKLFRFERKLLKALKSLLLLVLAYCVPSCIAATVQGTFVVKVAPWEAGVRQDNFGGGLHREDLRAGDHYELPGFTAIQGVDVRGRMIAFGTRTRSDSHIAHLMPALDIRTVGNQSAQVALAVAWHVRPGAAHQLVGGALLSTLDSKVADKLADLLQVRLAALDSEEWFDTGRRKALADELEVLLGPALEPLFVEVDGVYIERVRFSDDYETKLQEQQVSHQLGLLHDATRRVEEASQDVLRLTNETKAQEAKIIAEWEQAREQQRVDFDLELTQMQAEVESTVKGIQSTTEAEYAAIVAAGEQALAEASAFAQQRRLELLSTPGGQVWLAMRAADQMKFGEVWLDSRDPRLPSLLDLDAVVQLLMGANAAE